MAKADHTILWDTPDNRVNTRWFTRWNVATLLEVHTDYILTLDIRSCIIYSVTAKKNYNTDYILTKDIRSCITYSFTAKWDENAKNCKLQC